MISSAVYYQKRRKTELDAKGVVLYKCIYI